MKCKMISVATVSMKKQEKGKKFLTIFYALLVLDKIDWKKEAIFYFVIELEILWIINFGYLPYQVLWILFKDLNELQILTFFIYQCFSIIICLDRRRQFDPPRKS